jgi:hypothetical protein
MFYPKVVEASLSVFCLFFGPIRVHIYILFFKTCLMVPKLRLTTQSKKAAPSLGKPWSKHIVRPKSSLFLSNGDLHFLIEPPESSGLFDPFSSVLSGYEYLHTSLGLSHK